MIFFYETSHAQSGEGRKGEGNQRSVQLSLGTRRAPSETGFLLWDQRAKSPAREGPLVGLGTLWAGRPHLMPTPYAHPGLPCLYSLSPAWVEEGVPL